MTTPLRTAVILAAGMGSRLAGQHSESPKGFLVLGEKPIVEESLDKLVAAGVERIVIVTGHLSEFYEKLAAERRGQVETVHNPDFADSGSMYSLFCARPLLGSDFLLLESDLVYERRALQLLLEGEARDAILLSGPTNAGDEVYVEAPGGFLSRMSKDRAALGAIAGELVGISRVSAGLFERMCELAAPAFEKSLHLAYETDSFVAAAADRRIECPLVPDLLWGEIDDAQHLSRVRDRIYPKIKRRDG